MLRLLLCILLYASFLICGCAFDIAHVRYQPAQLVSQQDINKFFVLKDNVSITSASCYERTLRKGTKWRMTGSISEGNVYKPLDQVLTLECSNVHEAYLVVLDNHLVGFYLPVEKGFVRLSDSILLPIEK
jgi:hypothetical protein